MKSIKKSALLFLLFSLVLIVSGCGAEITNKIIIDENGTGIREIICTISENDIEQEIDGGETALDKVLNENKPTELNMNKTKKDGNIEYTFSYEFKNIEEFKNITEKLAHRPVDISLIESGNVFNKTFEFIAEPALDDIIKWAPQAVVDADLTTYDAGDIYDIGETELYFCNNDGRTFYSNIDADATLEYAIENIDVFTTIKSDDNLKREIIFSIPESTEIKLNENNNELDEFFQNLTPKNANLQKNKSDEIIKYNISFTAKTQNELRDFTNEVTLDTENDFTFIKTKKSSILKPTYSIEENINFENLLIDIQFNNPIKCNYTLNKKYAFDLVYDYEIPKEINDEIILSENVKLISKNQVEVMHGHDFSYRTYFNSKIHSNNYILISFLIIILLIAVLFFSWKLLQYLKNIKFKYNTESEFKDFTFEFKAIKSNIKTLFCSINVRETKEKIKGIKNKVNKNTIKKYIQDNIMIIKGSLISLSVMILISIILVSIINKSLFKSVYSSELINYIPISNFADFSKLNFWEIILLSFTSIIKLSTNFAFSGIPEKTNLILYIPILILTLIPFIGVFIGNKFTLSKNSELSEKEKFMHTIKIVLLNSLIISLFSIFLFKSYTLKESFFIELNVKSYIKFSFFSVLIGSLFWQLLSAVIINYKAVKIYLNKSNYSLYIVSVFKALKNAIVALSIGIVILSISLQIFSANKPWSKDKAALYILGAPNIVSQSYVISSGGVLSINDSNLIVNDLLNISENNSDIDIQSKNSYNVFLNIKSNPWYVYVGILIIIFAISSGFLNILLKKRLVDLKDITVFSILYSFITCIIAFINRINLKIQSSSDIAEMFGIDTNIRINITYNLFYTFIICFIFSFIICLAFKKIFQWIKPIKIQETKDTKFLREKLKSRKFKIALTAIILIIIIAVSCYIYIPKIKSSLNNKKIETNIDTEKNISKKSNISLFQETINVDSYTVNVSLYAEDENQNRLWSREWDSIQLTELPPVSSYVIYNENVYIEVQGALYALDIYTGKELWNEITVGSIKHPVIDTDGTIYCSGYYGPFITAISDDGKIKWQLNSNPKDEDNNKIYWPYDIIINEDTIYVMFDGTQNPNINCCSFDKKTGELIEIFKYGESNYNEYTYLDWDSVFASKTLVAENYDYSPSNVLDNNLDTAWVEGNDDYGINEWIELKNQNEEKIQKILLRNGFQESDESYNNNSRIKKLKITFSDNSSIIKDIADSNDEILIDLDKIVTTSSIKFTILDVYPGSKYKDTCITEIKVIHED